jgi:hypothetical protein
VWTRVFDSWQSDLQNNTNRGVVKSCIEKALDEIRKDKTIPFEPEYDTAIRKESGSPHIATRIFRKIRKTCAVVSDVSIVYPGKKPAPNPNVLVELGYAARAIGWPRVVMVMNTAFGGKDGGPAEPKDLPFDIGYRYRVLYSGDASIRRHGPQIASSAIRVLHAKGLPQESRTVSATHCMSAFSPR